MFTTSLEVSKQLKESGIEIKTEWWWVPYRINSYGIKSLKRFENKQHWEIKNKNFQYSDSVVGRGRQKTDKSEWSPYGRWQRRIPAPTLGELVRKLPEGYRLLKLGDKWMIFADSYQTNPIVGTDADTPEDATAKMLMRLREEGR